MCYVYDSNCMSCYVSEGNAEKLIGRVSLQIHAAGVRASKSTASMGKFDKQPASAAAAGQAKAAKVRQKAKPVASKTGAEKAAQRAAADKLIRENS